MKSLTPPAIYQAHLFNGMYCDAYRDAEWCQPYKDVNLMMKWNDARLSDQALRRILMGQHRFTDLPIC